MLAEVINLGESVINIKDYAFAKCSSIKMFNSAIEGEFILPESVRVISSNAFEGLISITKVIIPDSVSAINANAFKGCISIEDITIPFVGRKLGETSAYYTVFGAIFGYDTGSIYNHPNQNYDIPTSIKTVTITAQTVIPEYAFRNCNFIETIILPSTVTSVGDNSFYNCPATVSYTYNTTTSIWSGNDVSTSFAGSGTEADPYQINSAADLAYLASSVNSGESYEGKYFILNVNINLNSMSWTPIGTKNKAFAATFDGNGMKTYNLSVTMNTSYAGLFGYVSGTIRNLGIVSGTLSPSTSAATTYVGPLVAYLTGNVENCYSHAAVTINVTNIIYVGGLLGHVDTTGNVKDSYASGHVSAISTSGFAYAGGFVGANKGAIEGCLAFGDVTAKGSNETYSRNGGFVATNTGTITECYRSESQILTKYTTAGSAYCNDGIVDSYSNMISYAQSNWDSSVWEYDLKYPTIKYCNSASVGLNYTLNADGESYSVSGIGTCTDAHLVIPSFYNGLPVTNIAESAFHVNTTLVSVTIGNGIQTIERYAFSSCYSLANVTIGNGVTSIGYGAFYKNGGFMSITYQGSIEQWYLVNKDGNWNASTQSDGTIHYYPVYCTDGEA